jgi:hypothetical protein
LVCLSICPSVRPGRAAATRRADRRFVRPSVCPSVQEPLQPASGQAGPLVKLWGEDALLDWPGALAPVIDERDAYMARTLWAAATGTSGAAAALAASA